jgi:DNA-binding CsgD family transcriptional regulator
MTDRLLTERQKQILTLIAQDCSNKEMAKTLCITEKTVEFHKHRIKRRTKSNGPAGMVRFAIRTGLLEP